MQNWFHIATSRDCTRRAFGYTIVVGVILILINHIDALIRGDIDTIRVVKMGLTILVPYTVSTLSSVQSLLKVEKEG